MLFQTLNKLYFTGELPSPEGRGSREAVGEG
jgi:hypothetical protein